MKWVLTVSVVFICLGIALSAVGLAMGGYEAVQDYFLEDSNFTVTENLDLGDVRDLDLRSGSYDLRIERGETFGVRIENTRRSKIEYTLENGKLKVFSSVKWSFFLSVSWFAPAPTVTVYVPDGAELQTVYLHTTSGDMRQNTPLNAKDLTIKLTSGHMELDELTADTCTVTVTSGHLKGGFITAGTATLRTTSGELNLSELTARYADFHATSGNLKVAAVDTDGARITVTSGDLTLTGNLRNDTAIKATSGSITCNLAAPVNDYNRKATVTSGSLIVNGRRDNSTHTNADAVGSLDIRITSGTVRLNFGN